MKLWLISRADEVGYDQFDSCVVAAETEDAARLTHPAEWSDFGRPDWEERYQTWAAPETLEVRQIGTTESEKSGVICASFNAG